MMNPVEKVQHEAQLNKWSYPQIFEALKAAGVTSYTVEFTDTYASTFEGSFGKIIQNNLEEYQHLHPSSQFSEERVQEAIRNHIEKGTTYLQFLKDVSKAGVSHYRVNMDTREIYYYNPNEKFYHLEIVPKV